MDAEVQKLHLAAGLKCGEQKTCGKKVKYTEEKALVAAANHNRWKERRHDVEPYPCPFCQQWHVGNIMPIELLKQIAEQ